MHLIKSSLVLLTCLTAVVSAVSQQSAFSSSSSVKAKHKPASKDVINWDKSSMILHGKRIMVWSGEIHPWRLPVPGLWIDVLQKIHALGFNTVSIYTFWGLVEPSPGEFNFSGHLAIQPFLDACVEVGLWVIARPGPYINAEVSGGGIPGWVIASNASLRTNDPVYTEMWKPYMRAVGEVFVRNQISQGGPIIMVQIENETWLNYAGDIDLDHIVTLEDFIRDLGYDGPLSFNDVAPRGNLVKGKGAVDIYGFDSYPFSSDCSKPYDWTSQVLTSYLPWFRNTSELANSPNFIPEFQGGWFKGWNASGTDQCATLFGPEFERVWYLHNLAQGLKMINYYMTYGGTNVGQMAHPGSYSSYDYGAVIKEDRRLAEPKYSEQKVLSHFIRYATGLAESEVQGNGSVPIKGYPKVVSTELRNPGTGAGFYIVRHANTSCTDVDEFVIPLECNSQGENVTRASTVTLNGRDSRVLVTNFAFGRTFMPYCTASIMLASGHISNYDVLLTYGDIGQHFELAMGGRYLITPVYSSDGPREIDLHVQHLSDGLAIKVGIPDKGFGVFLMQGDVDNTMLFVADTITAYSVWNPVIPNENGGDYSSFWNIGSNETALIIGPYLVRSAISAGNTLEITGDLNQTTSIFICAPPRFKHFRWNGEWLDTVDRGYGFFTTTLEGPGALPTLPKLTAWRYHDSLPELQEDYDDSSWTKADHTETNNPNQPYFSEYAGRSVLYGQDYHYHVGNLIFRGHVTMTGKETEFKACFSPGTGGAASVYLNGRLLGAAFVGFKAGKDEEVNKTFALDPKLIRKDAVNTFVIVSDHMGYEESGESTGETKDMKIPRGVRGYELVEGSDIAWKIQGNLGGNVNYQDKSRSIFNEGGLYAERKGFHLPGFDDSEWKQTGVIGLDKPGIGFFRTEFELAFENALDSPISVVFPDHYGLFRAQLWINGWMLGKRTGDCGPQLKFHIHRGILQEGKNTIAISLWSFGNDSDSLTIGSDGLRLEVQGSFKTAIDWSKVIPNDFS